VFAIKVQAKRASRTENFNKTINTIKNFISEKLNQKFKIISDESTVEIVSGSQMEQDSGDIVVEMVIKKSFIMNSSDFQDRAALDHYINNIKNFCEQAKAVDEYRYMPFVLKK
jgi:hypothetical protein